MDSENLPVLPQMIWGYIVTFLEDAKDLAIASVVSKCFREACYSVRSIRINVTDKEHENARNNHNNAEQRSNVELQQNQTSSKLNKAEATSSEGRSRSGSKFRNVKDKVLMILSERQCIEQLRIEAEPKLQAKNVPDVEKRRTDFWICDPYSLKEWLPGIGSTLQQLCIVDYGQQAIMRRSSIVMILSNNCPLLTTLELRNMFIDTSQCGVMNSMKRLTLRCVKVVPPALNDINHCMPNLDTLALLGVFGVEGGDLKFEKMKVLCLGLSSPAKSISLDLPMLEKLQLKMQCPENLKIWARLLKYVAFNLEVPEGSHVQLRCEQVWLKDVTLQGLHELLYGASSFNSFADLVQANKRTLRKIYFDIPCMVLGEDGNFMRVLDCFPLTLPKFSELHGCEALEVLNIGPGLWHSMEKNIDQLKLTKVWPKMHILILHMILFDASASTTIIELLLSPLVKNLTIRIHTSSPGDVKLFTSNVEQLVRARPFEHMKWNLEKWTKKLSFNHFSF